MAPDRCLRVLVAILLLAPLAGCASDGPAPLVVGERTFYALHVGGQIMGYSTYRVTGRERQGQREQFTVASETLLQVDVGGQLQAVTYRADAVLAADFTPIRYSLVVRQSGGVPTHVTAEQRSGAWHLGLTAGELEQTGDVPLTSASFLLDHNLYDHYALLLRAVTLRPGERRQVRVLVPQGFTCLDLTLAAGSSAQELTIGGRSERGLPIALSGEQVPAMTLWQGEAGRLLRLEVPAHDLFVERADEHVIDQVGSVPLASLLEPRSAPSNVRFSAYWNVRRLRARLAAQVIGEQLDASFLADARQTFVGTVEDGWVRGEVRTQPARYALDQAPAYPVEGPPDTAFTAYLQPEEGIECADPIVAAKAREVATGARTTWQAVRAIGQWVHRNIAYEVTAGGASACLSRRRGDCGPQTRLVIAMCRAVGLPARMVGGLIYSGGSFRQHYWAEVYLGPAGWVPIDATAAEFGELDGTHIRLWQAGTLAELSIEVLDYEDRAELPTPLPRRDAELQAGQQYTYTFAVSGQTIGSHSWQVLGPERLEGREVLHLQAHLDLGPARAGSDGSRLVMVADLWVTPQAEPLRYQARAQAGEELAAVDVRFDAAGAHAEIAAHGQQVASDVPTPPGTYLLANNMAGWLALLYRSLDLRPGETLAAPVYLAENVSVQVVHLVVGPQPEPITVAGRRYECLVVEVPEYGQKDYVTTEGLLVRQTVPAQDTTIDLVGQGP